MTVRLFALPTLSALALATLLAPSSATAQDPVPSMPLVGELTVKLNGYLGREETLVDNLDIRVQGLAMRTAPDGSFHLSDLGVHGRVAGGTGRVTFDDDDNNWVRFALGRQYLRLPIVWVGEARGDAIVLYPVLCELNADESGACFAQLRDDRAWEGRLRDRYNLTPLPQPAAPAPAPTPPARPAQPEPVIVPMTPPSDGVQDFEPLTEPLAAPTTASTPVAVQPPAPPAPPAPPRNVPAPGELPVIEPLH